MGLKGRRSPMSQWVESGPWLTRWELDPLHPQRYICSVKGVLCVKRQSTL
jgi:hypothetical protein